MADSLSVRASMLTDVGRQRQVNEDWCGVLEPRSEAERERDGWLWIVADGVGAYGTGEEASSAAGEAVLEAYRHAREADPVARLRQALEAGNRAVWERRRNYVRQGQSRPVMTTLLAALVVGERAILANVGDCRAYLIRGGRLQQLTRDHTWVADQVERGLMSPEQARNHPRSHVITRSLGQYETVEVDLSEQPLGPGDRLVLCSDGLIRHLEDPEILEMASSSTAEATAARMLDLANARGGEDNITIAVIEVLSAADRTMVQAPIPAGPGQALPPHADAPIAPPAAARPAPRTAEPQPGGPPAIPAASPIAPEQLPVALPARRDHLAALLAVGQRISASLNLTETLNVVIDSVVEVVGGERGFIMLWDEARGELDYSIGRNLAADGRPPPEFSRNIVQSVFRSGQPIRVGDALSDPRFNQFESVVVQSLRSILCAALEVKGKRIGVVYVENRLGAEIFSEDDLQLLCAFAGQAAIALENARLYEQVKSQMAENAMMRTNQENVLRSINSGIVSLDAAGRVLLFNRSAAEIFGVPAERAHQRSLAELLPASLHRPLAALTADRDEVEADAGPDVLQLEARLPHRGRAVLSVRVLPLADASNRRIGSVLVIDDLTQQRLLEEARQREATEKERIKAVFGRYLAPWVVDQLMDDPGSANLGGVRREVSVLFADIRGFTGISERHPPEEVVSILNTYLACATEVILGTGGTLDKFLGDGVMAFFNAPLPQEDHVLAAVRAALQMQTRLRELQGPGGGRIAFGVGINTGEGVVGNIGTPELMNYTIIGDVVNVAARLQGEARAGEVLLSASAYERVAESIEAEELGSMHVKGRAQPVQIYKVLRLAG